MIFCVFPYNSDFLSLAIFTVIVILIIISIEYIGIVIHGCGLVCRKGVAYFKHPCIPDFRMI